MRMRAALLAVAALGVVACAFSPAGAGAKTVWLCKPGKSPDPCRESLRTTVVSPDGASHVETPRNARKPKFDCFYVYPTVSEQPGPNADKSIDPQQTAIAEYQAARYSQRCRVFAPVYRQLTLSTLFGQEVPDSAVQLAYSDVRKAWRDYLKHFNHGRGVVLIGHSQGTFILRALIDNVIDKRPKVRKRLISAILLGGNVTVKDGRKIGGDFKHIPGCSRRRQVGCVIAFSTFNETPPDDALFGRPGGRFGGPSGPGFEVLCTNPASLSGGSGPLQSLLRTTRFPGTLGAAGLQILYGGPPPTAPTPWLQPQDHYTGRCVSANGANVLMISPVGSARHLTPSPDATWGLHLTDANIGLGNLVSIVTAEYRAYAKAHRRRR
jgi:Protein of unknown function (DUF3089)